MNNSSQFKAKLARQLVVGVPLLGVSVAFIVTGRQPGGEAFIASATIAALFLAVAILEYRYADVLGLLAFAVVTLAMMWDEDRPISVIVGLTIIALSTLVREGNLRNSSKEGDA
ncbi:MAG: hypothetical protein GYB68_05870 [Chloroflexi bacterium]|nr:hypothetical protein [Chloroflexota bacterium]